MYVGVMEVDVMDFGGALRVLKAGGRVRRSGWNGVGMFVALMGGVDIPHGMINGRTKSHVDDVLPGGEPLRSQPYLAMWTAQGTWQPGWLASQADILADDWAQVPDGSIQGGQLGQ